MTLPGGPTPRRARRPRTRMGSSAVRRAHRRRTAPGTAAGLGVFLVLVRTAGLSARLLDRRHRGDPPGAPGGLGVGQLRGDRHRPEGSADSAADEARPHPSSPAQPGPDVPALDPERRASATVPFGELSGDPDIVARAHLPGQRDVPVRKRRSGAPSFRLGQREEVEDAVLGEPDHRSGAAAAPTPPGGGRGARHTGHTTADRDISVLQAGHRRALRR